MIRPERPADADGIRRVLEAAFGRPDEALLVERLRAGGHTIPHLCLVALVDAGQSAETERGVARAGTRSARSATRSAVENDAQSTAASDRIVGHVCISVSTIENTPDGTAPTTEVLALGPIGVDPAHQREGVGSALMEAVVERARGSWPACVLVGHPSYYPRFGFVPASGLDIASAQWELPPDVLMVLPLGDALPGPGRVWFPPPFVA